MRPPIWAYGIALVAVLGALGGAVAYVRHEGYRDGQAAARAECMAAQQKQERANQSAIDAANKQLVERADELIKKELQLDDYVKANDLLAAQDAGAADPGLRAGSVRRLNTIR